MLLQNMLLSDVVGEQRVADPMADMKSIADNDSAMQLDGLHATATATA